MDYGLVDCVIFRNTEFSRIFVKNWLVYSSKGSYIVEERSVFNFEILAHLRDVLNKPPDILGIMEKGGNATMFTVEPGSDIRRSHPRQYNSILSAWAHHNYDLLVDFYGPRPWSSTSVGRQQSKICLYETLEPGRLCYGGLLDTSECGIDLNSGHSNSFFKHFTGSYKYTSRERFLKWTRHMANSSNATIASNYCDS